MQKNLLLTTFLVLLTTACATHQNPSVIDRSPSIAKKVTPAVTKPIATNKDWRPDTHTVVKGDTLFSLGLQYGEYYKDIATRNNLTEPYIIKIGQQLKIKDAASTTAINTAAQTTDSGVILTPLKKDSAATTTTTLITSNTPPSISEPKATREVYSEQAMAAKPATATKPAVAAKVVTTAKPDTVKPAVTKAESKPEPKPEPTKLDTAKSDVIKPAAKPSTNSDNANESITWAWPTQGKVIAQFNDTANAKGIDISGSQGQSIMAAANGKVIYTGSDLRGYGKLVIIKHDKNYLSVYAHNSKILVKEGATVSRGDKISEMGNTDTDIVKLHFEIRQQGRSVDPMKFLSN